MSLSNIELFEIKNIKHIDKSTNKVIIDDLSLEFPIDRLTTIYSENKEIVNLLPRILTGNEKIDSGFIILDKTEVGEDELKKRIYYSSLLNTKLLPNITIKDVLETANNANKRNEKLSRERMKSIFEIFQIKTLIEKKTDDFNENKISKNKKKIILLLEAILKSKQIIVFDSFPFITAKSMNYLKKYLNKNKITLITTVNDPTVFSNIQSKKYLIDNNGLLIVDPILKTDEDVKTTSIQTNELTADEDVKTTSIQTNELTANEDVKTTSIQTNELTADEDVKTTSIQTNELTADEDVKTTSIQTNELTANEDVKTTSIQTNKLTANEDVKTKNIKSILGDDEDSSVVMSKLYDENYENTITVSLPTSILFSEDNSDNLNLIKNNYSSASNSNPFGNSSSSNSNPFGNSWSSNSNPFGNSSSPDSRSNPFGNSSSSNSNPFGNSSSPDSRSNPFGNSSSSDFGPSNPFGNSTSSNSNPFGNSSSSDSRSNPFGNSTSSNSNPFGNSSSSNSNPFGNSSSSDFGPSNPFGNSTSSNSNPFGNSSSPDSWSNPFGNSTSSNSNPFGNSSSSNSNPFGNSSSPDYGSNSFGNTSPTFWRKIKRIFSSFFKKKNKSSSSRTTDYL